MPRRSGDSQDGRAPKRVRTFVTLLVLLAVIGAGTTKFLKTTRGQVFLVDHGVESALPRVEQEIGATLKRSLEGLGLRRELRVRSESDPIHWDIPCDEDTDLLLINVALT